MDPIGLRLLAVTAYALTRVGEWRRHSINFRDLSAAEARELVPTAMRQYYAVTLASVPLMLAEAHWGTQHYHASLFAFGAMAVGLGYGLRAWAIHSLGRWWTMRCMTHPGMRELRVGPYRFLKHPEYVARLIETLGLAVVIGAPWTGLACALVMVLLARRIIPVESEGLSWRGGGESSHAGA